MNAGRRAEATPANSFEAHFRLAAIHPFSDGNGRTARLLMNLLLLRGEYPPVAVRPEDRKACLDALEPWLPARGYGPVSEFPGRAAGRDLAEYLNVLEEAAG